jgi:hypothetical protein
MENKSYVCMYKNYSCFEFYFLKLRLEKQAVFQDQLYTLAWKDRQILYGNFHSKYTDVRFILQTIAAKVKRHQCVSG